MTARLTPEFIRLITTHIRSLEELHVLITCVEGRDRWWDADVIAAEVGMTPAAAQRALEHLAQQNLLDVRITGEVRYQFSPGRQELVEAACTIVDAYRRNPLPVTKLVTEATGQRARDFADAFRIRRDDAG